MLFPALFALLLLFSASAFAQSTSTECIDYCDSGVYYTNGVYSERMGQCVYEMTVCRYGCSGTHAGCAEAPPELPPAVDTSCNEYCARGVHFYEGAWSGTACQYASELCAYGCDAAGLKCIPQPPDCSEYCQNNMHYYNGVPNAAGGCTYNSIGQCAYGCDSEGIGCAICGDGVCEGKENASTCYSDCHCGDGTCDNGTETVTSCAEDCFISVPLINITVPIGVVLSVSNVKVAELTSSHATITWDTNIDADSRLYYWSKGISKAEQKDAKMVKKHELKTGSLAAGTTYSFYVSGCTAEALCAASDVYNFTVEGGPPIVRILTAEEPDDFEGFYVDGYVYEIEHGQSAVFKFIVEDDNEAGSITDVTVSWDDLLPMSAHPVFGGELVSGKKRSLYKDARFAAYSITWTYPGMHTVTLTATNNFGKSAITSVDVKVKERAKCKDTDALYYPVDTDCDGDWTADEGETISYNSKISACSGFEVCSGEIDYIARDAENCCNGEGIDESKPGEKFFDYSKRDACDKALESTRKLYSDSSGVGNKVKYCKAAYVINGFGSYAVYMKDYFHGELCCAGYESHCYEGAPVPNNFKPYLPYFIYPWPASNILHNEMRCNFECDDNDGECHLRTIINQKGKVTWLKGSWATPGEHMGGWWESDTDPSKNNMKNINPPTHASVNIINTGVCTDYSMSLTTALRKVGYLKNEIYTNSAPLHSYNFLWLPGDTKYSLVDTVGNTGGGILSGTGNKWHMALDNMDDYTFDNLMKYTNQCTYDEDNDEYVCFCIYGKNDKGQCLGLINSCYYYEDTCSNDLGWAKCPTPGLVKGCKE